VRDQPGDFTTLICGEQSELAEHGLGLILRRTVASQHTERVGIGRSHQNRNPSISRSVFKKVQQAAGDVLAQPLLQRFIVRERGNAEKSAARPQRIPIPQLR
jgi:ABC-type branched-subunit amino acid transport system ATPase component